MTKNPLPLKFCMDCGAHLITTITTIVHTGPNYVGGQAVKTGITPRCIYRCRL